MKYLVAVSGGIDSVVLLDMLVRSREGNSEGAGLRLTGGQNPSLVIAHFDHGIRSDSAEDARFVRGLAAQYGLPYVQRREELGAHASEELARSRRYLFLGEEALAREATIATAHHQDDIVETVAINLIRGTGWRGLAVLNSRHIARPLLDWSKEEIRNYALEKRLEWVEDSTNATDAYLRNRVRNALKTSLSEQLKRRLLEQWGKQCDVRQAIEEEVSAFTSPGAQSRYFFTQVDSAVAEELLRALVMLYTNQSPTRPQVSRALLAVKTARPGTAFRLGGVWLRFSQKTFSIST